jgi:hypothetical protein
LQFDFDSSSSIAIELANSVNIVTIGQIQPTVVAFAFRLTRAVAKQKATMSIYQFERFKQPHHNAQSASYKCRPIEVLELK